MKQAELRKAATCAICDTKILATGLPLFYRVTIERHGIDIGAVRQQAGLEMMLGSPVLAAHMGPDLDMTKPLMEPVAMTVCEPCSTGKYVPVAMLAEIARDV